LIRERAIYSQFSALWQRLHDGHDTDVFRLNTRV